MNAILKFVMSFLAKKSGKAGITTIPKASGLNVELTAKQIQKTLENMGVDVSKIKSTKEVQKYLNIHQSWLKQTQGPTMGKKSADVLDLTGKKIDTSKGIMGGFEVGTKTKTPSPLKKMKDIAKERKEFSYDIVADTIATIKSKKPIDAMKEANSVIGRKGKYKKLTPEESKKILKDTEDHIFERDIKYDEFGDPIKPDPEDFAGGGRASTGLNYLLGEDDQNVRVPYGLGGGFNAARRAFLKIMGAGAATGVAAKSGLFSLLKAGKPAAQVLTSVPIKAGVDGMPVWFKPLVNKVIKEGDDVTKKFATKDREIVHRAEIDKDTTVDVIQDLDTGNVRIEYDAADNLGYGPIQLDYKAGEVIEQGSKKGTKTKPEFSAVEAEPRVANWDGDIEFDGENIVNVVDDLLTDTTKLETYATGKNPTIKKLLKSEQKKKYVNKLNDDTMEQLDYIENKSGHMAPEHLMDELPPDDMASGGRVPLGGGKLVLEGLLALGKGAAKGEGKFTKSEVLIQMLENTLKGSKDSWTKINLPNFIKEIKANPKLANEPKVWNYFTKGLPKNQRLVVYSDDTVDFWRQSKFGPHNIETTNKFLEKHPYLKRDQAVKIQNMEPEDQILEMKRLETIRDRSRTKHASGGLAGMLGE